MPRRTKCGETGVSVRSSLPPSLPAARHESRAMAETISLRRLNRSLAWLGCANTQRRRAKPSSRRRVPSPAPACHRGPDDRALESEIQEFPGCWPRAGTSD